ncbi:MULTISPECIES: winged helix-turn-helix domain-containing protein [Acidianus]|uniref:DNA-binding protein n=1 Tax=Candidatus Acidianus copahuensis TaxID=1160895 RepID=A0A031LL03_9CREN|nr:MULTISPECIES: winged helix-turn-helix domain-containing protein [Acidianus]EZQ04737.1 DNA-binding protein [Candidatus Acidianus copahuensis]NON63139.1 LysR family transcriptional regulator [Acidianus sp. RZ1]
MKFNFKLWIEDDEGKSVIGKGGVELLKAISTTGSISKAAENLNLSYKFAWEYIRKIEKEVGGVEMKKGGKNAGGTNLSPKIQEMLKIYDQAQEEVKKILEKYTKMIEELNDVK